VVEKFTYHSGFTHTHSRDYGCFYKIKRRLYFNTLVILKEYYRRG